MAFVIRGAAQVTFGERITRKTATRVYFVLKHPSFHGWVPSHNVHCPLNIVVDISIC